MIRAIVAAVALGLSAPAAATELTVTYLKVERRAEATLSNLDPVPQDLGLAGAQLGLADNRTTGQFMGHEYVLNSVVVTEDDDPLVVASTALAGSGALVIDAAPDVQLAIADLDSAQGKILFNATNAHRSLRDDQCRANLLHTLPSDAMLGDALAQYLVSRRWTKTAMIAGPRPADQAFAAALERSMRKFGLKPGKRADWTFDADLRRSAAQEVPLFTQPLGDYDVLLITDKLNDFARYVAYNTWVPRPVAGSEGLQPVAWDRVVEQWGAAQLQSRFHDVAGRNMRPEDYAAWAAIRTLGEAMTRTGTDDIAQLRAYIMSETFELAGFKGRPLSFRSWNGQLRQPIPLVHASALVAQAPLEGFLHQHNELDSLGLDRSDSACTAFED